MQPSTAPMQAPGPSGRVSVALIIIGLLVGASTLFKIVPAVVRSFTSQHVVLAPGSTPLSLTPGKYVVFERSGSLRPEQVHVTGPDEERVTVTSLGAESETITRGSVQYEGVATFRASTSGEYEVEITSEPRQAIVARSLIDTFGGVIGWFLIGLAGGGLVVLGVILLIIGIVRRSRSANRAGYPPTPAAPPWPPPDWPSHPQPPPPPA
jgi:hypothetical protein